MQGGFRAAFKQCPLQSVGMLPFQDRMGFGLGVRMFPPYTNMQSFIGIIAA